MRDADLRFGTMKFVLPLPYHSLPESGSVTSVPIS